MYCKKCGKMSKEGQTVCSCGERLQFDEYCGGFWGLVGKEPSKKVSREDPVENKTETDRDAVAEKQAIIKIQASEYKSNAAEIQAISDNCRKSIQSLRKECRKTRRTVFLFGCIQIVLIVIVSIIVLLSTASLSKKHLPPVQFGTEEEGEQLSTEMPTTEAAVSRQESMEEESSSEDKLEETQEADSGETEETQKAGGTKKMPEEENINILYN